MFKISDKALISPENKKLTLEKNYYTIIRLVALENDQSQQS